MDVRRRLPGLLRDASATWVEGTLQRDPPGARERLIGRETRIAGNIRGYDRRPYPPVSLLIVGGHVAPKTMTALRQTSGAADVAVIAPGDGAELGRRLSRTGDRYLLVVEAGHTFARAEFVELVERLEVSGRHGLARAAPAPAFGSVAFHPGRTPALSLPATSVAGVIEEAVHRLPEWRFFAVGPRGTIVPRPLPPLAKPQSLAFVVLAASRPGVTRQAFDALSQAVGTRRIVAIIPSGAATARKVLSAWPETTIVEDDVDPNLGVSLNRILAGITTDLVLITRDDTQVPRVGVARMMAAFARIPGLGAVGPRVNGGELPEGLADVQYRDLTDMEGFAERDRSVTDGGHTGRCRDGARPDGFANCPPPSAGRPRRFHAVRHCDFTRRLRLANVRLRGAGCIRPLSRGSISR